jgi:hypothetical protein
MWSRSESFSVMQATGQGLAD